MKEVSGMIVVCCHIQSLIVEDSSFPSDRLGYKYLEY